MSTVGRLETRGEINTEWSIPRFFSLSRSKSYYSHPIEFSGQRWYLMIYPNRKNRDGSDGWIAVNLVRWTSGDPIRLTYAFCLRHAVNEKYTQFCTFVFDKKHYESDLHRLLPRSELEEKRTVYAPADVLTVTCFMKKSFPHVISRTEKLSEDLKELMVRELDSDITVRVKGEEFRLHQNVLGSRIAVFNAMFKNQMKDSETGVVCIDDTDPGTFRTLIRYVYTGAVEDLSSENVTALYEAANKYLVIELKEDCLEYLKGTLSVCSFIDILSLALRHNEEELMECAEKFFTENMKILIEGEKWKIFAKDFPAAANDLLMKAVVHYSKK